MITCGEALEMVRMAMWEAGFPKADLSTQMPTAPYPVDPLVLSNWNSDAELLAFFRGTDLVRSTIGLSPHTVCPSCRVEKAQLRSADLIDPCSHVLEPTS